MILEKLKYIAKIVTWRTTRKDWDVFYVSVKDNPLVPILNMNLKLTDLSPEDQHELAEHIYFICKEYPLSKQFRTPKKFINYLENNGYEVKKKQVIKH